MIDLYLGDYSEKLSQIPDNSVDLVLTDPPYGTTPLVWDQSLDIEKFWKSIKRVVKETTPIVMFGQEPFSSFVRTSNLKEYRYDWYWQKERLTNVFQVKRRPGKTIENIMVFYKKQCIYNMIKNKHLGKKVTNKVGENARWSVTQSGYNQTTKPFNYIDDGTRYPTQLLKINRDNPHERLHPTQKPVELLEYLIKTYTNENMVVLDPFFGSGSCAVACLNTNRNFIGMEIDEKYYKLAKNRIDNTK